jgi:hypothetical protein
VVAELKLNSVNPPPDTIEEESENTSVVNATEESLIHITQLNVWNYITELQQISLSIRYGKTAYRA